MKGMDAVKESITQASERVAKLIAAGRIESDGTVTQLRKLLTEAEVLADEVRARELTRKEVMQCATSGAGSESSERCAEDPEAC